MTTTHGGEWVLQDPGMRIEGDRRPKDTADSFPKVARPASFASRN
jgi:hypothetical protein